MATRNRLTGTLDPAYNELGADDRRLSVTTRAGQPGPPGPPGPPGSPGPPGPAGTVYETRASIEAATIPLVGLGGPKTISVAGYSVPGDGGDATYARYSGTPGNYYDLITDSLLSRPNRGFVRSLDGQWWRIVIQGRPLRVECFGAKADYYILTQSPTYGEAFGTISINSSPTDNRGAIQEAIEFTIVAQGSLSKIGPTTQLGYGGYYSSDVISPYRSFCLQGMGLSPYEAQSIIIVAPGKVGIHVRSFGEDAPNDNRVLARLRDFKLQSLGFGGQTNKPGIEARNKVLIENVFTNGFGGPGIQVAADVGSGSEGSCFVIRGCYSWNNRTDGIEIYGGDANAGLTDACNFVGNYYWGLNDHSFLGNSHSNHHAATNGFATYAPYRGGPYRIASANGPSVLIGCYSEGDQRPSQVFGPQTVVGGLHAAGVIDIGQRATQQYGNLWGGGVYYQKDGALSFGINTVSEETDSFITFGTGVPDPNFDTNFRYLKYLGWGFKYGNPVTAVADYSIVITPTEWSWYRLPWIRPNSILLPKGAYVGGLGSGSTDDLDAGLNNMRHVWVNDDPTANTYAEHRQGDLAIATDGKSLGRLCVTPGVKTANWTSGSYPTYGTIIKTTAGHVYFLNRVPYDPDAWPYDNNPASSTYHVPRAIKRATHTSGAQNYAEDNQLFDPATGLPYSPQRWEVNATEHPTLGFYTWKVVDESLYPGFSFADREVVPHWDDYPARTDIHAGSGDTGTWMRNPTNGITYACQAVPQRPAKIYDQTWVQPASTVEPTHTSGTVDPREPNPAPSGSEPSTIPGYEWAYQHSNVAPAYARVGQVVLEGSVTRDLASLASGAEETFTIPVTGALMTDFVQGLSCSVDTQGMDIRRWLSANGTVSVRVINDTTGTINLANATWTAVVARKTS